MRTAGALLLLMACSGGGVVAQQSTSTYRQESVAAHTHGTAVAVALRVPAGSGSDPAGLEGAAWLLGRVLEEQINRALDPAAGVVTVSVDRSSTVVTLLAVPDGWRATWERVDAVLFRTPLDVAVLDRLRAEHLQHLAFEAGSPFRDFQGRAAGLLADPGSPFTRAPHGSAGSVAGIGVPTLEAFRAAHLRRDASARSVVGPVRDDLPATSAPAAPPAADDVAWLTGDRIVQVEDVTSTWISVAYPVPSGLPRTHLDLVAHLLREELDPTPPPPDRYGLDVRIEETPRGPVLVVEASVFPEAAGTWESRIVGVVGGLASEHMGEDFFRWRRRRFRAALLLRESAPEAEAQRATADLLRDGRVRDLTGEIWGLDAGALRLAAASLGPPRVFVLGPDLAQEGGAGR
jgi:hypothetical protein